MGGLEFESRVDELKKNYQIFQKEKPKLPN